MSDVDQKRAKLAKKIAKLLRRAERDDGPEADTAAELANRLMSKHGITVELHEVDLGPEPDVFHRMVMFVRERDDEMWAQFLLQELAPAYSCMSIPEQVDAGWVFHVAGSSASVELCATHFEYLRRQIQVIAKQVIESLHNPMSAFGLSDRVRDAIHWGVMDALRARLAESLADRVSAAPPTDTHTVTVIPNQLALPAAENVAVRGDEIAICEPGSDPFEVHPDAGPDVELDEPPRWAWNIGFSSVDPSVDPQPPEIVFAPVARLDLPVDVIGALGANEIRVVAQLLRMRPSSILQLEGFGEPQVIQIIRALAEHGLLLTAEWDEDMA